MNAGGERRRRQPHVAADGDALGLEIGDERRADRPRGVLVDLARIDAADVVGLEDVWIQIHVISFSRRLGQLCGCRWLTADG